MAAKIYKIVMGAAILAAVALACIATYKGW
jgi:hypothetical protein